MDRLVSDGSPQVTDELEAHLIRVRGGLGGAPIDPVVNADQELQEIKDRLELVDIKLDLLLGRRLIDARLLLADVLSVI